MGGALFKRKISMRKLVWISMGFAAACLTGAILYGGWLLLAAVIMLVITGALAILSRKNSAGSLLLLTAIGCTAGLVWFGLYDQIFVMIPRAADGKTLSVSMEATDYSTKTDYGSAVEAKVTMNGCQHRVKAYLNKEIQLAPGDMVTGQFRFRLTTDGGLKNPTNHRSEGIFLLAYSVGESQIEKADGAALEHYPAIWRRQLLSRIQDLFPQDAGAFASALLLGERSGITYRMNTSFKLSGISHIIAVSGLHVSILFGLIHTLLARRRFLSCVIGIPVLFLFAAIAGFTPSITRACIMQSLMLIAMVLDREYDGPSALAFAVMVMLVINPLTILSVSFQLSVGCMVGIFLFSERIRQTMLEYGAKHIRKERAVLTKLWKSIVASVSVSLSASVMTTPLVAYYFGCVSLLGIVTNLLTLWVISFIFYGLIVCLMVSVVSLGIAKALAMILSAPIYFVLSTARLIADFPLSAVYTSDTYVSAWLIGIYVMLGVFLFQKKKQTKLLAVCMVFTFLLTQTFAWLEPMDDDFRVTLLDVGQGQSILLQSDGKTFLVDCGGDDDEVSADVTVQALMSQGIARLDGIIVTHYDRDHAGGLQYLLSRVQTDRLILPGHYDSTGQMLSETSSAVTDYVCEDVRYSFGDTEMTVFASNSSESGNESSICILFQQEDCGILITGDRSAEGERELLARHDIPQVDILIAGHHGSATSTSQELLTATTPEYVFISVGAGNRYGHPAEEVLQRLEAAGCEIYRTDTHGTIIFRR